MKSQKSAESILVLVLFQVVVYLFARQNGWLYGAVVLGLLGLLIPPFAKAVHYIWMKLATILGYITGRVILMVVFFLVLVPLSLLSRLFSRNSVQLKAKGHSNFQERNFTYTPESFENVW